MTAAQLCVCLPFLLARLLDATERDDPLAASIPGKVAFHQIEGNNTYLRSTGELATNVTTVAAFELSDPRRAFRLAGFSYMWDIGDGQPKVQHLPYVRYNYSVPGNYTVKLKVDAYWNKTGSRYQSPRTASYITDLKVLDAVRTIEVTAPSSVKVDQGTSLSVCITGSPPVVLCWVMVPDCVAVSPTPCHLVMLYGNTLYLNYTFTSTGRYCLNMTARNDISSLQSSHDITVSKGVTHPVFFILPCATLIIISLGFIIFSVCRPHRSAAKIRVEEASFDFSCHLEQVSSSSSQFEMSSRELSGSHSSKSVQTTVKVECAGEASPLLHKPGRPVVTYLI